MNPAKKLLKTTLRRSLNPVGAFPTAQTSMSDVSSLLESLFPKKTEHELIRLGPRADGGYLVPDVLEKIAACFSPGVNDVSGFELDCAERGMEIYMADKSVDGPAEEHPRFHFTKKFLGVTSNEDFMTLDSWVANSTSGAESDLLLQIDIEGHEYEVFLSTSDSLMNRFKVIVAEFHQLDQLWNRAFFSLAGRAFEKILQTHTCVHLHPNNCCGTLVHNGFEIPRIMEFTFLRKDEINQSSDQTSFPHRLDVDNTPEATLPLPSCWYKAG